MKPQIDPVIEDIKTSKEYFEGWCSYYHKGMNHLFKLGSNEEYKQGFNDARINNKVLKNVSLKAKLLKNPKK